MKHQSLPVGPGGSPPRANNPCLLLVSTYPRANSEYKLFPTSIEKGVGSYFGSSAPHGCQLALVWALGQSGQPNGLFSAIGMLCQRGMVADMPCSWCIPLGYVYIQVGHTLYWSFQPISVVWQGHMCYFGATLVVWTTITCITAHPTPLAPK